MGFPCTYTDVPPPQLVFVTTLFYLLCYSERNYRPVKWVMDALPQLAQGEGKGEFAEAFSRAIRSVKMSTT